MARKPSAAVVEDHTVTAAQTPGMTQVVANIEAGQQLEHQHEVAVRALAAQIGYQLPADCTDPDLIQRDISANMRRSVEACLEVGRGLAVLKAACGHGNFIARLDVLGIDRKVSAKFMQAAAKLSNVSSTRHLEKALGNQTKLFEMLVLDDEQLEELELTGQVGELHLDDIATMSVKELRAALREAKANATSTDRVLGDKEAQITKLQKEVEATKRRVAQQTADEVLADLLEEVQQRSFAAFAEVSGNLRLAMQAVLEHCRENNLDIPADLLAGAVCQVETGISRIRGELSIKDKPDGSDIPYWQTPEADAEVKANMAKLMGEGHA
jgi:hypothetical protein